MLTECVLIGEVLDLQERIQNSTPTLLQTVGRMTCGPHHLLGSLLPYLLHLGVREDALQIPFCNSGS